MHATCPIRWSFEVFTVMKSHVEVLWVVTACSDAVGYRRFREPCCLHLSETLATFGL